MHLLPNPKSQEPYAVSEQQRVKLQENLKNKLVLCSMGLLNVFGQIHKKFMPPFSMFPAELEARFSVKIRMNAKWAGIEEISHMQPRTLQLVRSDQESGLTGVQYLCFT